MTVVKQITTDLAARVWNVITTDTMASGRAPLVIPFDDMEAFLSPQELQLSRWNKEDTIGIDEWAEDYLHDTYAIGKWMEAYIDKVKA